MDTSTNSDDERHQTKMICNNTIWSNSVHFNLSAAASPAELNDQSQDEGSTIEEYSFLHAPHPRQNQLKWVPIYETVQEGTGLKVIHPFLMDKNSWMDIMFVQHILADHPFSATI